MEDLTKRMDELMRTITEERAQRHAVEENLRQAHARIDTLTTQAPPTPAPPAALPHPAMVLASPKPFNGARGAAAESFISQIGLHTISYPDRFPDDASKLRFSLSFLTEYASTWAQPYLTKVFNGTPVRFDDFIIDFKATFFDPSRKHRAEVALRGLRQTGTVAAYTQDFNIHARVIEWDDTPLMAMYQQGLKENVRLAIVTSNVDFLTLQTMQAMALKIGNAIDGVKNDTFTSHPPPRHPAPDPNAMDLSALQSLNRLSDAERARCLQLGLCLRCRRPGHQARDCRGQPKRSRPPPRQPPTATTRIAELQAEINSLRSAPDPNNSSTPTASSSKNGGAQV